MATEKNPFESEKDPRRKPPETDPIEGSRHRRSASQRWQLSQSFTFGVLELLKVEVFNDFQITNFLIRLTGLTPKPFAPRLVSRQKLFPHRALRA